MLYCIYYLRRYKSYKNVRRFCMHAELQFNGRTSYTAGAL